MRYLQVNILKPVGFPDCSNGGATSFTDKSGRYFIAHCRGPYSEEDISAFRKTNPTFILSREGNGSGMHLRPKDIGSKMAMFGGAFAWSSDSRFRDRFPHPMRIHDRIE